MLKLTRGLHVSSAYNEYSNGMYACGNWQPTGFGTDLGWMRDANGRFHRAEIAVVMRKQKSRRFLFVSDLQNECQE